VTREAATGAKLSRTELNVLQTMIFVIICFIVCWSPGGFTVFIELGIKAKVFCLSSILFFSALLFIVFTPAKEVMFSSMLVT